MSRMKIEWHLQAVIELREIVDYIDHRNRVAAKATYQLISGCVSQLAIHPFMGRDGRVKNTRELIVGGTPYLIAYQIDGSVITVLAVMHAARRWPDDLPV
ncbi:type II toxin-antitoxin system RelE/ParE family toxin [Thalassospira alkalitolerans]|uniref:type II toxin-antitoxin system RelE/ParE family toxin n=1 Tax=Thalassospira alkalitolerans TaxID=1293890 RepID=UPI003AA89517